MEVQVFYETERDFFVQLYKPNTFHSRCDVATFPNPEEDIDWNPSNIVSIEFNLYKFNPIKKESTYKGS